MDCQSLAHSPGIALPIRKRSNGAQKSPRIGRIPCSCGDFDATEPDFSPRHAPSYDQMADSDVSAKDDSSSSFDNQVTPP